MPERLFPDPHLKYRHEPFVIGYGPKVLAAEERTISNTPPWPATIEVLEKHGLNPMSPDLRRKDGCFVIGGGK